MSLLNPKVNIPNSILLSYPFIIILSISIRVNLHQEIDASFAGNAPSLTSPPLYPSLCFNLII